MYEAVERCTLRDYIREIGLDVTTSFNRLQQSMTVDIPRILRIMNAYYMLLLPTNDDSWRDSFQIEVGYGSDPQTYIKQPYIRGGFLWPHKWFHPIHRDAALAKKPNQRDPWPRHGSPRPRSIGFVGKSRSF